MDSMKAQLKLTKPLLVHCCSFKKIDGSHDVQLAVIHFVLGVFVVLVANAHLR